MTTLDFDMTINVEKTLLEEIFVDYEYYSNYLKQIESVEIIKNEKDQVVTKETLVFSTYLKNKIIQTSVHKKIDDVFFSEILDGPAKGTIIRIKFLSKNLETKITVNAKLKLSLKAKIFYPIVKKAYKHFFQGVFYKMETRGEEMRIKKDE
jgi:hypothetical protein